MTAIWRISLATFPGQAGNPVGHLASPGWSGSFALGPLTTASYASSPGFVSGSAGSPTIISFVDFRPATRGQTNFLNNTGAGGGSAVHDITFVGCRFTARTFDGVSSFANPDNCLGIGDGCYNIVFSYCTFAPLVSVSPNPVPSLAWPSSSVGTGATYSTGTNTYTIPYDNAFQFTVAVPASPSGTFTFDHCDLWGFGDGIGYVGTAYSTLNIYPPNGQVSFTDCWIHDCRNPTLVSPAEFDHTDGIIVSPVGVRANMSNLLLRHNTISAIGNTNNIALQHLLSSPGCWSSSTNYTNETVGATDGFAYTAIAASGPGTSVKNPTGNAFPAFWTQSGINSYRNVSIINNHLSGWKPMLDFGAGCDGNQNIVVTDNVISNYVMWETGLFYNGAGTYNGPYQPYFGGLFNGTAGNLWLRNTYQMYPGSGASYDVANAGNDGKFVLPDNTFSTTDWHN